MESEFKSGWARVTASVDNYRGRVARVIECDSDSSGDWVTLEIDGMPVTFDRDDVKPCACPAVEARRKS